MHQKTTYAIKNDDEIANNRMKRRDFINTVSKAAGGIAFTSIPFVTNAYSYAGIVQPTVGDIIDLFIK